jgi:hypothetical protein
MKTLILIMIFSSSLLVTHAKNMYNDSNDWPFNHQHSEIPDALQLKLYPNPTTDYLNVQATGFSGNVRIQLISILGQIVAVYELQADDIKNQKFDVSNLPIGAYNFRLTDGNRIKEQMFVTY